jgi:hypothetical protein
MRYLIHRNNLRENYVDGELFRLHIYVKLKYLYQV